MVTVNKQLPVRQIGKCVDRKIVHTPDFEPALVLCEAWDKLPQQADGGEQTCPHGSPDGNPFKEIPARAMLII
jgi:hypothetical protein